MHAHFHPRSFLSWYLVFFTAILLIAVCPLSIEAQTTTTPTTTTTTAPTTSGGWLTFRGNPAHTGVSSLEGPAGPSDSIQVKWRWRANNSFDPVSASPAVKEDGTVIIGTEGNYVAAIRPDGGPSWIFQVDGPVLSSPSVDESGNIFVVTSDGYMYYLSAAGKLIWKSDFNRHTDSSPVISGGTAYLGTNDDELLTITLSPDMSNNGESTKLPPWVVQQSSFLANGAVHSSPAFSGDAVLFGGGEYVYALNPNAGGAGGAQTANQVKWQASVLADVFSSPAVAGGKVYVGTDGGYLYAFSENISTTQNGIAFLPETETGLNWTVLAANTTNEPLWKRKLGGKIRSSPAVVTPAQSTTSPATAATNVAMVYVGSDDGCLYAYDENGQFKWKFPTYAPVSSSPAVDKNGNIYFGSENGSVYALFPDGALKWVFRTNGPVRSSPAIGPDKRVYVGSDDGYLYAIGESDEPNREPDFNIEDNASPDTIENEGTSTIITATVTSQSNDPNILSSVASVALDLTPLKLLGIDPATGEFGDITNVPMLDNGEGEDRFAGDGIFTFAFGITTDQALLLDPTSALYIPQNGVYTYYLLEAEIFPVPRVGPVPLMVTITDIYGHRVSKPFALNIAKKIEDSVLSGGEPFAGQIINGLSNQTLNVSISITSGIVKSIEITPNTGSPGNVVTVIITGQNTNFTQNKTAVLICNGDNQIIASAIPGTPTVTVLNNVSLVAQLTILQASGGLNVVGIWDVKVITDLGGCPEVNSDLSFFCPLTTAPDGCELVIAKQAFTIGGTQAQSLAVNQSGLSNQDKVIQAAQEQCQLTFAMLNPAGVNANKSPFDFSSSYPREFVVPQAANGGWTVNLSPGTCQGDQQFKITTRGSNYGVVTGQVTNGFTGERIDDVTIAAIIGDLSNIPNPLDLTKTSNYTKSSGGGFYMLPLAATRDKYTVFATQNGLVDYRDDVVITADKETTLNFSLKLDLSCPVTALLKGENLNTFYAVRDRILLNSPQGKRWVALYYRHAHEVTDILLQHPDFRKKALAFIIKAAQESRKILKGEKADRSMRVKLEQLIDSLIKLGSPALKNSLSSEKKALLDFIVQPRQ